MRTPREILDLARDSRRRLIAERRGVLEADPIAINREEFKALWRDFAPFSSRRFLTSQDLEAAADRFEAGLERFTIFMVPIVHTN